jgi:hypothetical protein
MARAGEGSIKIHGQNTSISLKEEGRIKKEELRRKN